LSEAEELADQIAIIRKGKIIAQGSPSSLKRDLLGPAEYEVQLKDAVSDLRLSLPPEAIATVQGTGWFRYRTFCPEQVNPAILQDLLAKGYPVLSLQEIPRNLEQVYLQAVTTALEKGA
jgi:ABC-2 type transport system ATP-binding protein